MAGNALYLRRPKAAHDNYFPLLSLLVLLRKYVVIKPVEDTQLPQTRHFISVDLSLLRTLDLRVTARPLLRVRAVLTPVTP